MSRITQQQFTDSCQDKQPAATGGNTNICSPMAAGGFSPHLAIPPAVTTPKKYVVLHNTVCPENQQVRALILGQGGLLCSCVFLAVS